MQWLIDNVGAALIGLVITAVVAALVASLNSRRKVMRSKRFRHRDSGPSHRRFVKYLQSVGTAGGLYRPVHLAVNDPLPVLSDERLMFDIDARESGLLLHLGSPTLASLPESKRAVGRRIAGGTELWNGELLHATGAMLGGDVPQVSVERSSYFSYVTAVERVVRALWSRMPSRRRVLENFKSLDDALAQKELPLRLSGATAVVVERAGVPRVIVHRRSDSVVNAPGIRTVVPAFGFDAAIIGDERSDLGTVLYNVAREYGEELFDYEDAVRRNHGKWYHPDQIVQLIEEIKVLLGDMDDGHVRVRVLGMCVNPKDCDLNIAILVRVGPESRSAQLLESMRGSWEAQAGGSGEPAVQVFDLFDLKLDSMVDSGEIYPTSAFAIDRARCHFTDHPVFDT